MGDGPHDQDVAQPGPGSQLDRCDGAGRDACQRAAPAASVLEVRWEEFLYELKAGPAGGRLRRPSSAGRPEAEDASIAGRRARDAATSLRLLVSDMDASIRFYRDILGFQLKWGEAAIGYASSPAATAPTSPCSSARDSPRQFPCPNPATASC